MLGIRRPDASEAFAEQADDLVEIVKLGIFAVFGSLLTIHGLTSAGWAGLAVAAATLLVVRPDRGDVLAVSDRAGAQWLGDHAGRAAAAPGPESAAQL